MTMKRPSADHLIEISSLYNGTENTNALKRERIIIAKQKFKEKPKDRNASNARPRRQLKKSQNNRNGKE